MTEVEIEKLRQIVSRTDKSGNEKVEMLIELIENRRNNLTYRDVIEIQNDIKIKTKADTLYNKFMGLIKLDPYAYKNHGLFLIWDDSNNRIYIQLMNDKFHFICDFLHEDYDIELTPDALFKAIKEENRGIEHLESILNNFGK